VLAHSRFAYLDHERVLSGLERAYGVSRAKLKKVVLAFPPFAGLDHERVLSGLGEAYGVSRARAIKVVLMFPRFAGLNHSRVLCQKKRIARLWGLNESVLVNYLLKRPVLASYSLRRDMASVDAINRAVARVGAKVSPREMFDWYIRNYSRSPYAVKGSKIREGILERGVRSSVRSEMGITAEKWFRKHK
ncbi:MAG: hypothetical protein V1722_01765, partial [Candidatus Micrarchaeota archaeon]